MALVPDRATRPARRARGRHLVLPAGGRLPAADRDRADDAAAGRRPRGRGRHGPRGGRGRRTPGGLEQRRQHLRRHRGDRRDLVAPGLRRRRPRGHRAAAATGGRRRAPPASCSPPTPRCSAPATPCPTSHASGRSPKPGWVGANAPATIGLDPGDRRRRWTSGRPTSAGSPRATGLPVAVKGVLRADDAERCVEAGASAVWVSNHGGRQLDRVVATAALRRPGPGSRRSRRRGVRRRGSPLRTRRAARRLPGRRRRVRRPPVLPRARRRRGRRSVAGPWPSWAPSWSSRCASRGAPRWPRRPESPVHTGDSSPEWPLTCVNIWCDRGHSEPI